MEDLFDTALCFGSSSKENNTDICGLHLKVGFLPPEVPLQSV